MDENSKGDVAVMHFRRVLSERQHEHPHPPFNKIGKRKAVMFCATNFIRALGVATLSFVKLVHMNRLTGRKLGEERI